MEDKLSDELVYLYNLDIRLQRMLENLDETITFMSKEEKDYEVDNGINWLLQISHMRLHNKSKIIRKRIYELEDN